MLAGRVAIAAAPIALDLHEFNPNHAWPLMNHLIGDVLIADPDPSTQVARFGWEFQANIQGASLTELLTCFTDQPMSVLSYGQHHILCSRPFALPSDST